MWLKPFLSIKTLLAIIPFVLIGCDNRFQVEEMLSDYVGDLERSEFLSISPILLSRPVPLPTRRNRLNELSQFDIGVIDFLSLQQCDLGRLVGQKNSILGRVMPRSQRFLYELKVINEIENCLIEDINLAQELDYVAKKKRVELPTAFTNALFNGEEGEAFFSLSNGLLVMTFSTEQQQALLDSMDRLILIGSDLQSLPIIESEQFENDLKEWLNSEYGGKLLFTLTRFTDYLNAISSKLALMDKSVCGAPMLYLRQQFKTHYLERIQPYMGRVNRSVYEVLPRLEQLVGLSYTGMSPAMYTFLTQFFLKGDASVWLAYQEASQQHAKQWHNLFELCSLSPNNI